MRDKIFLIFNIFLLPCYFYMILINRSNIFSIIFSLFLLLSILIIANFFVELYNKTKIKNKKNSLKTLCK